MNSSMKKSVIALMVVMSVCSIAVAAPKNKKGTSTKKPAAAAAEKKPAVSAVLSAESIELCKSGTPEQVKAALDTGTLTVTQKNEDASTAIMLAAAKNPNPEVIKVLKDAGANPNYKTKNGQSAMIMAVRYSENPAVINALVEAGANVDEKDGEDRSTLQLAMEMGRIDMFKALIEAGADINARDGGNRTILMLAVEKANKDAVTTLISAGANVNETGGVFDTGDISYETCVLSYAFLGSEINKDIVNTLIAAGARADVNDFSNTLIRSGAVYHADKEIIDMVIKVGATFNGDMSWAAVQNPNIEVVKMFVDLSKVNEKNKYGDTRLTIAAASNTNPAVIELFLNAGADVNIRSNYSNFTSDNPKTIKHIDSLYSGATPLLRAAMQNPNPAVIELLLKHGAKLNMRNKNGDTPLIAAARSNTAEVVKVLLDNGANFEACNSDHKNAFDVAQKNEKLKNTDVFWELNDLEYNTRDQHRIY